MNWPALLLFCYDPKRYTIYKPKDFQSFMESLSYPMTKKSPDEKYPEFCNLCRFLLAYAQLRGYGLADMIDAHSLVWAAEREEPIKQVITSETPDLGGVRPPRPPTDVSVYDYVSRAGFRFPTEMLTNYLLSLKTKPFVILTGLSGTGKTKLAQLVARYFAGGEQADERRWAFVPVRPDWMDNKGLLGFHNVITERYEGARLLRLLLRAQDDLASPYFAILDEMNLSKVEYYFSDFLSCLESCLGAEEEPEKVDLHNCVRKEGEESLHVLDSEGNRLLVPRQLRIPRNVYFTGTVNVDETTYMFSPKVLDRANTIEFSFVDLTGAGDDKTQFRLDDTCDFQLDTWELASQAHWEDLQDRYSGISDRIQRIHELLQGTGHHFGYRVAFEMAAYILNAARYVGDTEETLKTALDLQISQKVLPKFHGTVNQIELPLARLLRYCIDGTTMLTSRDTSEIVPDRNAVRLDCNRLWCEVEEGWKAAQLPRSAAKVQKMLDRLKTEGFASFIG